MTAAPWYASYPGFGDRLRHGQAAELRLALDLLELGLAVRVDVAPRATREGLNQQVDIEVGELVPIHRVEIKTRKLRFTGPEDYPFETALVGRRSTWEERERNPCSVVLESDATGARVVVPSITRPFWGVERPFDSIQNFVDESYAAPRWALRPATRFFDHVRGGCR